MTVSTGGLPGHPHINGTRPRGTAVAVRRDGARPPVPAQRRAPAVDTDPWLQRGACGTVPPDLFFPISPAGAFPASRRQIAEAKAVCHSCPVIEDCRTWVLANPRLAEHGVWAGTTEAERRSASRGSDGAARRARRQPAAR